MYVCNSERIIKIGQYLRKLCSDEKESSFLTHGVVIVVFYCFYVVIDVFFVIVLH